MKTSASLIVDKPAWKGMRPSSGLFASPVPLRIERWILEETRRSFLPQAEDIMSCRSLQTVSCDDPRGHYHAVIRTGHRDSSFFFRVGTPWPRSKRVLMARINRHRLSDGVRTAVWLPLRKDRRDFAVVTERTFEIPVQLSIAEYIDLKPVMPTPGMLRLSGEAVAGIHRSLLKAPCVKTIRAASEERFSRLEKTRSAVSKMIENGEQGSLSESRFAWMRANKGFLRRFAQEYRPAFDLWGNGPRQVIHGDLNAGNILTGPGNEIVFIDLGETCRSFLPAWVDLVMFAERVILYDEPDNSLIAKRISAFLDGYRSKEDGFFRMIENISFVRALCQINYHAVAVLFNLALYQGIDFDDHEWNKFVKLEKKALAYQFAVL